MQASDLLHQPNDAASGTCAGIACRLALLVAALAEVVGAGVDDDGALACIRVILG